MFDTQLLIEIFGYIGSFLVVFSMLMSSVVKLRVINTIGSVVSGIYALICGAYPLVLMNTCLIVINVYNLYKLLKTEQEYDLVEGKADDTFLTYFLERYLQDIRSYFPEFAGSEVCDKAYVVCCNGNPAGVLLGNEATTGVIDVVLDYSIPTYRDCSVGNYLYSKLAANGVHTLEYRKKETDAHVSYLKKMGFVKENNVFVKHM